jgi:meiotically up-regulated gene 157 (Mug157) protein
MVGFYFYFRIYPTFFSDVMTQLVGVMSKAKDDANIQKLLPQYIELQKQSVNLSPLALAFEFGWTYIFCGFLVSLVSSYFAKGQSKIS